ncbi:MAG: hypothetical protein VKP62_04515 [Candidatus Sericytochromatia bacterium]|nr:hypothetical protein [Candidatus Sericytochromatia bacterium]
MHILRDTMLVLLASTIAACSVPMLTTNPFEHLGIQKAAITFPGPPDVR